MVRASYAMVWAKKTAGVFALLGFDFHAHIVR
jgi:hypothetical protein